LQLAILLDLNFMLLAALAAVTASGASEEVASQRATLRR